MTKFYKITSYLLLIFNILLVFLLVFESKVSLPLAMSPLGRMHPLLLHLPIGFVVILVISYFFRKDFGTELFEKISKFLLTLTGLTLTITALMGFFLSKEGGFDENILNYHKWTGALVSLFCYGLILFYDRIKFNLNSSGSWALLSIIALAGHFGATITHGENYLFQAYPNKNEKPIFTENNSLYEAAVYPIFEAKCISCHNEKKLKGQLNMASIQKIIIGGKNGSIWKPGDALNSHIIQRASLPLEDKKHMPPKAKPQLSQSEIELLSAWINEGANLTKSIKAYPLNSVAKALALKPLNNITQQETEKTYTFNAASEATIKELNSPYCTVFPIANNSPALRADFFVNKKFELKNLENLKKVSDQLVELNLAKMPIKDQDLKLLTNFPNLEKLILNQTDITGQKLDELAKCKSLISIALIGTKIKKEDLQKLLTLPKLNELFIWETGIDPTVITSLSKQYPKIKFDQGFVANPNELLKLNPPRLLNESFVVKDNGQITLKHNFKDVAIHYTLDGNEPDSLTKTIYKNPIPINSFLQIKAIATKNGWYASSKINQHFFKYLYLPDTIILAHKPNPKYGIGGTKILTDLKKGTVDNTTGTLWSGYRETDFNAEFYFKEAKPLKGITVSYLKTIGGYIMPPTTIEIWAGNTKADLKLIEKHFPIQPQKVENPEIAAYNLAIKAGNYKLVKIVAKPVSKLPSWHPGKGEKGWFFVDEVLFY